MPAYTNKKAFYRVRTWAKTGWKIEINYKKLAEKLGMGKLIRQRKTKEIQAHLQECYDVAVKMGYIEKAGTEEGRYASKEVIYLDKERFGKDKVSLALPK